MHCRELLVFCLRDSACPPQQCPLGSARCVLSALLVIVDTHMQSSRKMLYLKTHMDGTLAGSQSERFTRARCADFRIGVGERHAPPVEAASRCWREHKTPYSERRGVSGRSKIKPGPHSSRRRLVAGDMPEVRARSLWAGSAQTTPGLATVEGALNAWTQAGCATQLVALAQGEPLALQTPRTHLMDSHSRGRLTT